MDNRKDATQKSLTPLEKPYLVKQTVLFAVIYFILSLTGFFGDRSMAYWWTIGFVGFFTSSLLIWMGQTGRPRYLIGVAYALGLSFPLAASGSFQIADTLRSGPILFVALAAGLFLVFSLPAFSVRYAAWLDSVLDPNRPQNPVFLRLAGVAGTLGAIIGLNARRWFGEAFAALFFAALSLALAAGLIMLAGYGFWKYFYMSKASKD